MKNGWMIFTLSTGHSLSTSFYARISSIQHSPFVFKIACLSLWGRIVMHMSIEWAPYRRYKVWNVFHLCSTVIIIGIVLVFTVTFLCVSDFLWSWERLLAEFEVLLISLPFMRSGVFLFIFLVLCKQSEQDGRISQLVSSPSIHIHSYAIYR